jgi:hypothetical protein
LLSVRGHCAERATFAPNFSVFTLGCIYMGAGFGTAQGQQNMMGEKEATLTRYV